MATTKYMGSGVLLKRLAAQVGSTALAENILKARGHMKADGTLTAAGKKRDGMTARGRALDRAARKTGGAKNPITRMTQKRIARRKRSKMYKMS